MKKATITEKELRKAWTEQDVPKARQDAMIRSTVAKAQPGAMVGPFQIPHDHGATIGCGPTARPTNPHPDSDEGRQTVLYGAERASGAVMAQRKADAPLRPKANQRPCDAGLFSDAKDQTALF